MSQWSYADTSVYGPITKTVEDAAMFMDLVCGPSPCDPNSLPHPGISYLEAVRGEPPRGLKLGFSPDMGHGVVQSDFAAAVEEGLKVFESTGHRIEQISGGPPLVGDNWNLISSLENASKLSPLLPEREGDFTKAFLEGVKRAWKMTPELWGEAAHARSKINDWCAEIFGKFDALITPTVPYDPPPAKGPFPVETEGRKQPPASSAVFTIPFNQSFHPAATLRVGMSKAGFPVGMQIVGPRHREDLVLKIARAFEIERPWHPDWPVSW
jgi:Asp-tRNA(Asn)/Glu-tRNA(Gln) amidotransferase A subunit family amidase